MPTRRSGSRRRRIRRGGKTDASATVPEASATVPEASATVPEASATVPEASVPGATVLGAKLPNAQNAQKGGYYSKKRRKRGRKSKRKNY